MFRTTGSRRRRPPPGVEHPRQRVIATSSRSDARAVRPRRARGHAGLHRSRARRDCSWTRAPSSSSTPLRAARTHGAGSGVVTGWGTGRRPPRRRGQPRRRGRVRRHRCGHGRGDPARPALRDRQGLPDRLHQRLRRRADPRRHPRAARLRRHLRAQRRGAAAHPADLADPRPVRRRGGLLAGADRLDDHGQGAGPDVPDRPRHRQGRHGRGRHGRGDRRLAACTPARSGVAHLEVDDRGRGTATRPAACCRSCPRTSAARRKRHRRRAGQPARRRARCRPSCPRSPASSSTCTRCSTACSTTAPRLELMPDARAAAS